MDLLGYALEEGGLRPLHDSRPLHISASAAQRRHMDASQPAWRREIRALHPTWKRFDGPGKDATAAQQAGMGGALPGTCGLCHGPLHRLLSLDQPARAGVACDGPLSFGVCLSCLGWEESTLFYRHDAEGLPQAHPTQRKDVAIEPQFPAEPLASAEVTLFEAPARWAWRDWGDSNGQQNLSRVGGAPSWVQQAWYPPCPDCGHKMPFAFQLDSDLPQDDGNEWMWGSGGCNYSFWCAHCRVSGHFWQCTWSAVPRMRPQEIHPWPHGAGQPGPAAGGVFSQSCGACMTGRPGTSEPAGWRRSRAGPLRE